MHLWWPYCDCDCMVTDHHWWPYCDWLHGDYWPSLMILLWLTAWWLMITSHHTISHSRVINDNQSPYNQSDLPYCDWLHGDWSSLIYPTATDCMVTDHHWWPYCDWLYGDWLSLIYPTVTVIAWWLTIIDLPYCDWYQWYPVTIQSVTVGLSTITSHHTISHSRVNQW
jgi:hypothetical protein